MELPRTSDYARLFLDDLPMIDVRAPVEFSAGAFPNAINLPLLDDAERHEIGICHKDKGPTAAIELGEHMISGAHRERRIAAWHDFARTHPHAAIYCFRGGQRSQISQRWLAEETGLELPLVSGGYKAMRGYLLGVLEDLPLRCHFAVIGGRTGCGKTLFLQRFERKLDLEAIAWHRGSAFGRHATPQPTQIDFENRLAIALLRLADQSDAPILVEDESRNIGSLHIPKSLFSELSEAPIYTLESDLNERTRITLQAYIRDALEEYIQHYGAEAGFTTWSAGLLDSLDRIKRRLGSERHQQLRHVMEDSLRIQRSTGKDRQHAEWIQTLLGEYYDPMYDYQLTRNKERIRYSGCDSDLEQYLRNNIDTLTGD